MPNRRERQKKDEGRARKSRQRRALMIGGTLVCVLAVIALAVVVFGSPAAPAPVPQVAQAAAGPGSCTAVQTFPSQGRDHIRQGQPHPEYNSNPPNSGWHWDTPQDWGIYTTQQFQEQLVHNLEHGGVVVQYNDLPGSDVQRLTDLVNRDSYHMILAPYPGLPAGERVALTAWTHLQTCSGVNSAAIQSFVNAFRDQGPEKVP